jgi:phosphatidylinositol alpha-1,6-mannosyltransferase
MRQGVPVIATRHDAGQEVNVDGVTGFNVDLDHPCELSDRLIQLLNFPRLAAEMGQRGREHWQRHFPFSAFESRLVPILNEFVGKRNRFAA